jgi:hypothetical protein
MPRDPLGRHATRAAGSACRSGSPLSRASRTTSGEVERVRRRSRFDSCPRPAASLRVTPGSASGRALRCPRGPPRAPPREQPGAPATNYGRFHCRIGDLPAERGLDRACGGAVVLTWSDEAHSLNVETVSERTPRDPHQSKLEIMRIDRFCIRRQRSQETETSPTRRRQSCPRERVSQTDPYPDGSSAVKNRIRQGRRDRLGTQRHEILGWA